MIFSFFWKSLKKGNTILAQIAWPPREGFGTKPVCLPW